MTELELTLVTSPRHFPALKLALAERGGNGASPPSHVTSTYFDSADLKLRQNHLSLAIEAQDQRRVQALADRGGNGGPGEEWRDPIAGDRPDRAAPESGPRLAAVVAEDELHPLFHTDLRRTRFTVDGDPTVEIAAVLDEGEIRAEAGGANEPLCEVGLALKRGEPAALYDMALKLLDVAPLRIETRSQSDRGYRLAGADTGAARAKPFAIAPGMTVEAVLQAMGRECIGQLLRYEPAALAGEGEAFHQMRVALRRLRSALAAVKSALPPDDYRQAREELKWLASSLGAARNWDAFTTGLLRPVRDALPEDADLKRLVDAAKRRRRTAYDGAKEAIGSHRYAAATLRLARWFETRGWREQKASEESAPLFLPISDVAPRLIERRWRQVRKRCRGFKKQSLAERHQLRITLKKLRYVIEFLGPLYDAGEVKAVMRRVKPLQEELGHLNDVCTAQALMNELARPTGNNAVEVGRDAGLVLGWHFRGLADEEPKLRRNVRRLRRIKPFWHPLPPEPASEAAARKEEAE
ncbi:MAG TPA: CHAD domain-containing protein [Stellaceae bacterium]|nr:CHAD domain-containing protein [Stellaceae bacterium]